MVTSSEMPPATLAYPIRSALSCPQAKGLLAPNIPVISWLIGPYIDSSIKMHPDKIDAAESQRKSLQLSLDNSALGSIAEIRDAETPNTPRGRVA